MDHNNRPQGRNKRPVSGSAGLSHGQRIGSSGPVGGSGGGGGFSGGGSRGYSGGNRGSFGGGLLGLVLSLFGGNKKLLLIVLAVIAVIFLVKNCGSAGTLGSFLDLSSYQDNVGGYGEDGSPELEDLSSSMAATYTGASAGGNANLSVASGARERYVTLKGDGSDTVTVMVYLCGTDLESQYGMGTKDLIEMTKATLSEKVRVIVLTGGCKKWNNSVVSSSVNQIYEIKDGGIAALEENFGTKAMTDPENLTDFIRYCSKYYPASRNVLIFWDHGGGSVTGYGYDEKRGSSSMTLPKINDALAKAGVKFDFIGFDACLMATMETALVCDRYADYLIASEEVEPGTGWYYTNWLTALSKNPAIPTVTLAKQLADDFVSASCQASSGSQVTLSCLDLAELHGTVPDAFRSFASSTNALITGDEYRKVSDARAGVRQFSAKNRINQIDLVDLCDRIGTEEAKTLAKALRSCVKYNATTMSRAYGVSIYFPYESLSSMNSAVSSYNSLGMEPEYTRCIRSFASLEQSGQIAAASSYTSSSGSASDLLGSLLGSFTSSGSSSGSLSSGSLLSSLLGSLGGSSASSSDSSAITSLLSAFSGRSMPASLSWMDTDLAAEKAAQVAAERLDPARIRVTEKNGKNVLVLTPEEWSLIRTIELNVYAMDGGDYLDLGLDNVFEWNDEKMTELSLGYDGSWLALNGRICAYYFVSKTENADGSLTVTGRIPALLNDRLVDLWVVFDGENEDGTVTGAYPAYAGGETDTLAKGKIVVRPGDRIRLVCDVYDAEKYAYDGTYEFGDEFAVPAGGLKLEQYEIVGAERFAVSYRLTDLYGVSYWTPAIVY
ncbi:MAG: peptidase C11 [Clostridia bacterium]|nr:peptidase C11 [Clostridia bacterium]